MAHYYVDPVSGSDTTGDGLSDSTAWQSLQHALDTIAKGTYGDQINLKSSGANVLTANLSTTTYAPGTSASGAGLDHLAIRGYGSTANDGAQGIIDGNDLYRIDTLSDTSLIDLEIKKGKAGTDAIAALTNTSRLINCYVHSCNGNIIGYTHGKSAIVGCRFENISGTVSRSLSSGMYNCYFSNGVDYAFTDALKTGSTSTVSHCIFNLSGGSNGVVILSNGSVITNCTFYGYGGSGTAFDTGTGNKARGTVFTENIVSAFTTGTGVDNQSDYGLVLRNNTFHDCGTDVSDPSAGTDGYSDRSGNETVATSPLALTGSANYANRFVHFAPQDVGSVLSVGVARGAAPALASSSSPSLTKHPLARF